LSRFVLDASVVLALCFPDENAGIALEVARRLADGDSALAPSFWPHEVLNAVLVGEKRKRISPEIARAFLEEVSALSVKLEEIPSTTVFNRIRSLSLKHGLTAYDAAYLDLAIETGLPLATLDNALVRASGSFGIKLVGR
jgi:predicted nucleic acid-binding protein